MRHARCAWLKPVVKIGAVLGLFSTILVQMIGQTRIFYSMSRDGLLPEIFGRVHPRFQTPHISTIVTGVVCALVAGLTPINALSELVSMGTLLAFVLVCVGIGVLRRTNPDTPQPFPDAGAAVGRGGRCRDLPVADDCVAAADVGAADHLAGDWDGGLLRVRQTERRRHRATEA